LKPNRLLYSYKIDNYQSLPLISLSRIKEYLLVIGKIIKATPIYEFNLYENFIEYKNDQYSNRFSLDTIKKIEVQPFQKNKPFYIITIEKNSCFFTKRKKLLIFDPEVERLIYQPQSVIDIKYRGESKLGKKLSKIRKNMKEREKREKMKENKK
jgi:hypothetical protein